MAAPTLGSILQAGGDPGQLLAALASNAPAAVKMAAAKAAPPTPSNLGGQQPDPTPTIAPRPVNAAGGPNDSFRLGADAARQSVQDQTDDDDPPAPAGLGGLHPALLAATKRQMQAMGSSGGSAGTDGQDRALALAAAGFGAMGSGSPYGGVAIGQGGTAGINALLKMRQQRALMGLQQAEAARNQIAAIAPFVPYMSKDEINNTMGGMGLGSGVGGGSGQQPAAAAPASPSGGPSSTVIPPDVVSGAIGDLRNYPAGTPRYTAAMSTLEEAAKTDPDLQRKLAVAGVGKINLASGETLTGSGGSGASQTAAGSAQGGGGGPSASPVVAPTATSAKLSTVAAANPYALLPTPQPLPGALNSSMAKEQDGRAEDLGKVSGEIDDLAKAATQTNLIYNKMRADQKNIVTGKGSDGLNSMNAYLLQGAKAFNGLMGSPVIPTDALNNSVSDYQDLRKNQVVLTGAATKAVSPRASTQELQFLGEGVPSNQLTDQSFDMITSQLQGVQDYALAQQRAKQLWLDNPKNTTKTMNGFEAWFNQNADPAVFMLQRMEPTNAATLINSVKSMPNGQQMLQKIAHQRALAFQLGLFPED